MRYIYWIMPLIIFGAVFLTGAINLFYILCILGALVGAVLIFPQKTQKSWKHLPKLIIGSIFYGLTAGIFFIAIPMYFYLHEPSITFDYYFNEFLFGRLRSVLEIGGVSAFINFMSGLVMIVVKGFYYLIKERRI